MSSDRDTQRLVYVSSGGTASGRPETVSTASADALVSIIRDGVMLISELELLQPVGDAPDGDQPVGANKPH